MEIKDLKYKKQLKNINYTFDSKKIYGIIGNKNNITLLLELISSIKKSNQIKGNQKTFMIFENSDDQIFNQTVKEEILYGLSEENIDLNDLLTKVLLDESILPKSFNYLSKTEKKKVVFASMLATNPDIVLIDNFFNQIDLETQKNFISILKRLQFDEHKIIILADQNIDLLYEIVDEIIVLNDEILLSGNKFEVFENKDKFGELELELPFYIEFTDYVSANKNVKLFYRDRVTDIVKDVYDNVQQ